MAYSTWWARLLGQVGLHVDLRATLILADTNSEATAAGGRHGARRTDWQRVCQEHGLRDLAQMRQMGRKEVSCHKGAGSRIDTLAMWDGSWLELRDYEYWAVKVLSDWHYPLLWILSAPNYDVERPENVTCMREKEYHLHPIEMSAEMRYDYHRAILARPGRD